MAEIEIGIFQIGAAGLRARRHRHRPRRRTRDPEDVDISWEIDAYRFDLPAARRGDGRGDQPRDRDRARPAGRPRVLNLEGLWTRYEDPTPLFDEIRELDEGEATPGCSRCTASR